MRRRVLASAAAALALVASGAPLGLAADAPARDAIDLRGRDRGADPCTDFDAFANGPWRAAYPIPAGAQRWSRRAAARETNRRQLTALLTELAARRDLRRGSLEQQLGDTFGACMDEPAIESAGVTPLAPLLAEIAAVQDAAGIQGLIRRLHALAVPAPFVVASAFDYREPANLVASLAAAGLGLGDREAYVKADADSAKARDVYRARVARVLTLGGMAAGPAGTAAADILALETRLAEASLPAAQAADPAATAHRRTFAQLSQLAPHVDWDGYFEDAGLPRIDVNVTEPAFLERLDRELVATPVAVWKSYLTWHLLASAGPALSRAFSDEATAAAPRAARCLDMTETLLGEPLGRVYAERSFAPAAKAKVQEMTRTLLAVLKDDVRALQWMSEATRQQALAKIDAYEVKVGYPDTWTDTAALVIRRDSFWESVAAARRFGVEVDRRRIGHPASRTLWGLPPSSAGAYIDVQLNLMGLPAGFLQPWSFDPAATDAVNYGAIGAGVAHDLTHAIDALGAEFDATGQPRTWWAPADVEAFQKIGQCTVEQYDGYTIEPGVAVEGKRVVVEALGDLAGVRLAHRALHRSMQAHAVPTVDGLTPDQQFFLAYAQFRGGAETLELQRHMMKGDPHAPSKFRVIAPLANRPEFQEAFACTAGAPMVRPADARCEAW